MFIGALFLENYHIYNMNLMEKKPNTPARSTKHTDIQKEPMRVASRLEGVVKNRGIKNKKK